MLSLNDPDLKILIAEPSASARQAMSSVLRALGYTYVVACASLEEASGPLAKEAFGWLITALFAGSKLNALQVLLADADAPTGLRVTLAATESELAFVSRGFAMGLFSYLPKPFNRDQFKVYMEALQKEAALQKEQPNFIAATSLRSFLRSQLRHDELLAFETRLSQAFPAETPLLLPLARALFEMGQTQRGQAILWQAQERDDSLRDQARSLGEEFLGDSSDQAWPTGGTALLVDSDTAVLKANEKALKEAGAPAVQSFTDGEACWQWIQSNGAPALIIMEWRLPKLSGPALLQRLRSNGLNQTPVIVISSLVKRSDQPLLSEMGVASIVEKPVRVADLVSCIAYVLRQNLRPSEEAGLALRLEAVLASGNVTEARGLLQLYAKKAPDDSAKLKYFEAALAFHDGDYSKARDLAGASLNLGLRTASALNLLGKALMQLKEFQAAIQIFDRANQIAPGSIERLCAIAEGHAELGAGDAALAHAQQALALDAHHPAAIKTGMNVALVTGNAELMGSLSQGMPPSQQVLAFLNNKAVAMARSGRFADAVALYENALKALPPGREDLRGLVLYNLGLAHIQNGAIKKALTSLTAIKVGDGEVQKQKVTSLIERTRESLRTGLPPRLNLAVQTPAEIEVNADGSSTVQAQRHSPPVPPVYFLKTLFIEAPSDASVLVDAVLTPSPSLTLRRA